MNIDGHTNAASREASRLHGTVCDLMAAVGELKDHAGRASDENEAVGEEVLFLADEVQSMTARLRSHAEESINQMKDSGVIG